MCTFPGLVRRWLTVLTLGIAVGSFAAEPTPQPLPRLETGMHTAPIVRIATDATGRWAVTASDDKTARVWEVASGDQLVVLRPPQEAGREGQLHAVALSPDGTTVALGGYTGWEWERKASIYLFDRASGRLLRRLTELPHRVIHLTFSPDGRWLAVTLKAGYGVRVFDAASGQETGRDADYGGMDSYSAHFSPDGRRLLTTAFDGQLRLYPVADGRLGAPQLARPGGGQHPFAARFSPDGRRIAVGFNDSTVVQVLDAATLAEVARPNTAGIDNGNLSSVAWSADGRFLVAGGRWGVDGKTSVRRWLVGDWTRYSDLPLAKSTLMDFAPLPDGTLLFVAAAPAWGAFDPAGALRYDKEGAIADLRGQQRLRVSADGRRVGFSYSYTAQQPGGFDLARRSLDADAAALATPRTAAPGLAIENWKNRTDPTLNGRQLTLERHEESKSLAIAPDAQRFVLGSDWWLRQFDRTGRELWRQPAPDVAWAVNITADARFVVAAYGDGTIRWHRFDDGHEVLALFPHADQKRWIAWTPEGFYATSGPDAEALLGYHLNRGQEREGEFVSARQLQEKFYQPGLITRRLDADGDALLAKAVKALGDVRKTLAGVQAALPVVDLLSPARVSTEGEVTVKVRVRDQGGGSGEPIYRIDGVELEGRPAGGVAVDGTISRSFPLPFGRREITVTAANARGVESAPVRIAVDVRRPATAPALHVLAVGVSGYRDRELQKGVRFAAADAETIGRLFEQQGARLYRSVKVRVLPDDKASGDAIRAALTELADQVAPQDVFVLYLAGHGASFDREYHFIPWDAVYTSAAALRQRSLTHEHLRELLKKIPAEKAVVLLDTCSAGGFGRQDGRDIGQKDAIDRLSRLTGRALIAATADDKMALEGEGGHGAFTFALLDGLRGKADRNGNGTVEVRELADHVEELLPKITRKWGYEQYPFSSTEGQSFTLVPKP